MEVHVVSVFQLIVAESEAAQLCVDLSLLNTNELEFYK